MKRGVVILFIVLGVTVLATGAFALINIQKTVSDTDDKISDITDKISLLTENQGFVQNSDSVVNSTILILVKKESATLNEQMSGAIFVDEFGGTWSKGTGFSIGDGLFITATHVVLDGSEIILLWNGQPQSAKVHAVSDPSLDVGLLVTNLTYIPPVKIIKDEAQRGQKIGFIGFPLNEQNPMLNDGIISSIRRDQNYLGYTINSFVNRGNSGGPVFLSGSGEVIGVISSRQNDGILLPSEIDTTSFTDGEKAMLNLQMYLAQQLAANSQVGIGNVVGVNQILVSNMKNDPEVKKAIEFIQK